MDIAALTALAGTTLVAAAPTDVWEDTRYKVARLFGRGEPDAQVQQRLEATQHTLITAHGAELDQAQRAEARAWQARFADLLADHPDAQDELARLVAEIRAQLPADAVSAEISAMACWESQ